MGYTGRPGNDDFQPSSIVPARTITLVAPGSIVPVLAIGNPTEIAISYAQPATIARPVSVGASSVVLSKTTAIPPDTQLVTTNMSGPVSYIRDDPDSADSLYMEPSGSNVATEVRVGFELPPAPLRTGPNWQEFRIRIRKP